MCGRNAQFAAVLLSGTLLVNCASAWAGKRKEISRDGEIVAPDDRGAPIDEDVIAGNRPARARIETRLAGPTLAPSGGPATRCGLLLPEPAWLGAR